ncbi:MAG: dTMP kinase [Kiritimatiellia bacterium]|jgi:dTMP kinase|nr:dTMP kinase [Kiritimatiellia bacterium]MDP6848430.1 dTMP kinase [Kiritimatiellia bacterium]
MRGRFITLEGPEGSGKSTQAAKLCERLGEQGIEVVKTREPGGTATGELIREILQHDRAGEPLFPESEALLFAASRAQLVRSVILPALEGGAWVVCDRFADSTTAYQGYGRGFSVDDMLNINSFAVDGAQPDVTLLLDVDVALGFDRIQKRNTENGVENDRFEREAREFHERVRQGYLALAKRFPDRFRVIDASRDEGSVQCRVWETVCRALGMEAG